VSVNQSRLPRREILRFVGALSGAAAVTLLAACGGSVAATTSSATSAAAIAAATSSAAVTTAAAAPAQSKAVPSQGAVSVQVRFNGLDTNGQKYATTWGATYGPANNIKISLDFTDWASSFQKITTGIAGGIAPDIFGAGGIWVPVIVSKGGARALDEYLAKYPDWSDYYPAAQKDVVWKGKTYGVPYELDLRQCISHRKSLYDKAGIKAPPATWDEAHAISKELLQMNGANFVVSGWNIIVDFNVTQYYEDAVFQAGGHIYSSDLSKPTNTQPENEAALNFMVWFVQNKIMPGAGMSSGTPNLNAYTAGKVAQTPLGPHDLENTEVYGPDVYKDTLLGMPMKQVKQAQVLFVNKHMMFSGTKVPDAAWQVMQGLVVPDTNVQIFVVGDLGMPVRKAQASNKIYDDPRLKTMIDSIPLSIPREMTPQSFDIQPAMSREVEAALRGVKTVKQALTDMDAAVAKILAGQ
jgi:multiple sugar transport system substrate-binding protein